MMIHIANPIYDSVFKYLMEDERIAKIILSALLKKEVVDVQVRRNEYTNGTRDQVSMFRIDFGAQIAVGGRNDPRGHRFLAHIPDALRLLFLYYAQQFDLHRHGQLADFVEEDRPLRGGLKKPDLVTHRASKCAARMTKKLALQQGFRNGPTVDGHKRSRRSAQLVDGARDDFLSSTGFPGDENVGFGGCHASDKAHHFLHGVGLTDEVGQALGFGPVGRRGRPQKGNASRMRLGDEGQNFVAFERLFDVIKGAAAHGLNGRRRRRIRGDRST